MTSRADGLKAVEYTILTMAVLAMGFGYLALGKFDTAASQILMSGPAVLLFFSHLRYMKFVEGRSWRRLAPAAVLIWSATWLIEAGGVWAGLYDYNRSFLVSLRLGPVPILIPTIWVLFCWLASSILHFLGFGQGTSLRGGSGSPDKTCPHRFAHEDCKAWGPGRRQPGPESGTRRFVGSLVLRGLGTGWVMLSIALAIEWHLSKFSGLWTWASGVSDYGLDGVPWYNFYLWFAVGFLAPFFDKLGRAPRIEYRTPVLWLKALPVIGFGLVLLVNSLLNAARGYLYGTLCCAVSFLILVLLTVRAVRRISSFGLPGLKSGTCPVKTQGLSAKPGA